MIQEQQKKCDCGLSLLPDGTCPVHFQYIKSKQAGAMYLPINIEFHETPYGVKMATVDINGKLYAMEQKDWLDFARGIIRQIEEHQQKIDKTQYCGCIPPRPDTNSMGRCDFCGCVRA